MPVRQVLEAFTIAREMEVDDHLIEEARRIGRHATNKDAVTAALKEYVERRRQFEVLEMFGTVPFDPDHDYKKARRLDRIEI